MIGAPEASQVSKGREGNRRGVERGIAATRETQSRGIAAQSTAAQTRALRPRHRGHNSSGIAPGGTAAQQ